MVVDGLSFVPPWVQLGVALGAAASVLVAALFYAGNRLAPPPTSGASVSGDARRRAEIRRYLDAVGERFREDHALDGVRVPFYLPDRRVAITFDAHDYFRLEGVGVHAVLCEHEMPGRGLGRRLPFDVEEPDWGDPAPTRSAPDSVAAAFDELGVAETADAAEVKRAYRERVKEVHPDQGGDEEAFRRVQEAYATATAHADGDAEPRPSPRGRP